MKNRFSLQCGKVSKSGSRSRYLCGVASGLDLDSHGERVTANCIESICRQARQGDVLLFADVHGVRDSDDIGVLKSFEVLDNGDWYVEFKLYDEKDGVDTNSVEKATKLWNQICGNPPYTHPREKGFSIEGYVPDDPGLRHKKENLGVIDDMVLEGVVLVPSPAYKPSRVQAVYKSSRAGLLECLNMEVVNMAMRVEKALTPEEKAIVGNIKSLLQQLEGAVGEVSELPVQMSDEGSGMDVAECGVRKDETARETAEEKLAELPVDDEEALGVLKSLLAKSDRVAKSAVRGSDPVQLETLKVLKALTAQVSNQQAVLREILGGNELADQALGLKVQKSSPRIPVQPSSQDILAALGALVAKSAQESSEPKTPGSLADVLKETWR